MKVAITGANGFVASHIIKKFTDFVVIQRDDTEAEILSKLDGVYAVLNLAGAPIIKKWTPEYKKVLLSSRVDSTRKLVNAINKSEVVHFISTSAIGAYPDGIACDESFVGYGKDFLASLTQQWEFEALQCNKITAIIRFGVILGRDGGALSSMLLPFKLGLGGIIGDGKMMTSWIAIDDLLAIYSYILEQKLSGIFNATSPNPVTNYEFTKILGAVLNRPTIFPLPIFVLKILFGEGSAVLSGSKEVYPQKLLESGFKFTYPTIDECLKHILK